MYRYRTYVSNKQRNLENDECFVGILKATDIKCRIQIRIRNPVCLKLSRIRNIAFFNIAEL